MRHQIKLFFIIGLLLAPPQSEAANTVNCPSVFARIQDQLQEIWTSVETGTVTNPIENFKEYGKDFSILGSGHTSVVYHTTYQGEANASLPSWLKPGTELAVKIPKGRVHPQKLLEQEYLWSREIEKNDPDNLFARYFLDQNRNVLISPFLKGRISLKQWLETERGEISPEAYLKIESQLNAALKVLNQSNLVHSDLGFENILIDPTTFQIQVIDYGITAEVGQYPPLRQTLFFNQRGGRLKSKNQAKNLPAQQSDDQYAISKILETLRQQTAISRENAGPMVRWEPSSPEWIRLTTRNGKVSDTSYPKRLHNSMTHVFEPFVAKTLAGKSVDFESMLRDQHRILTSGLDGKNRYFGASMGIWNQMLGNSAVPGRFRNEAFHGPSIQRWRLTISIQNQLEGHPPIHQSLKSEPVKLADIPAEALPSRVVGANFVKYHHPDPKWVPVYLAAMKRSMDFALQLMKTGHTAEEILPHLADYLQFGLSGHIFSVANFSLYMTQINSLLLRLGYAGISPKNLDYRALVEDTDVFRARFLKEAGVPRLQPKP